MMTLQDDTIVRILNGCNRDIDKAIAEVMRRDDWLIRHAVRRGVEAIREADNEATRQGIVSDVLSGRR
jgi:hypothetical protein